MLSLLFLCLSSSFAKTDSDLSLGELYGTEQAGWSGNAFTTPKGLVKIHPFTRGAYGISDNVDVKFTSPFGLIGGPSGGFEVAFLGGSREELTLSFENYNRINWVFDNFSTQNALHLTVPVAKMALTASVVSRVGTIITDVTIDDNTTTGSSITLETGFGLAALRPELSLDIPVSERTAFTVTGRTDVVSLADGFTNFVIGGIFSYGHGLIGFNAGLNLVYGGYLAPDGAEDLPGSENLPQGAMIPLPRFSLWFRF